MLLLSCNEFEKDLWPPNGNSVLELSRNFLETLHLWFDQVTDQLPSLLPSDKPWGAIQQVNFNVIVFFTILLSYLNQYQGL